MDQKTRELFEKTRVKTILLRNSYSEADPNFTFFSGLPAGIALGGMLLLRKGKKPLLLATRLDEIRALRGKGMAVRVLESRAMFKKVMRSELKGKKIGLDFTAVSKSAFAELKKALKGKRFADVGAAIEKMREIKSPGEIMKIRKAVRITEGLLNSLPRFFKKGMTERELALLLEMRLRHKVDNSIPFGVIVASGPNSASPHHAPGNRKICGGFLLVDIGCKYKNYCSDLTRTFFVGKAGDKEKKLYSGVFAAKQFAIGLAKPGAKCKAVFKKTCDFQFKKTGRRLPHGLGHGLGLEAHDQPKGFTLYSPDTLRPGMVLTVEPAVYLNWGGVRIEDDIVITANGCAQLSKAPARLVEIR
ncbi:MAG: Xaa-Pro peptidase family protein [Candidatus Diapherotrites archaeon]|nr:Xaa-Pro peptidase family protein [Candidatus Diapherotrites archaeon]